VAAIFRNWARTGCTEGQSGHISVRDPEWPDLIWMNPLGRHFGTLTAGDMLLIDMSTGQIASSRMKPDNPQWRSYSRTVNAAGFYIHSAIHQARPDVHAICHAYVA
jgi:ribulose-5-phosphate 4-epimerase/fuculose-1-phosphate aldolase